MVEDIKEGKQKETTNILVLNNGNYFKNECELCRKSNETYAIKRKDGSINGYICYTCGKVYWTRKEIEEYEE